MIDFWTVLGAIVSGVFVNFYFQAYLMPLLNRDKKFTDDVIAIKTKAFLITKRLIQNRKVPVSLVEDVKGLTDRYDDLMILIAPSNIPGKTDSGRVRLGMAYMYNQIIQNIKDAEQYINSKYTDEEGSIKILELDAKVKSLIDEYLEPHNHVSLGLVKRRFLQWLDSISV